MNSARRQVRKAPRLALAATLVVVCVWYPVPAVNAGSGGKSGPHPLDPLSHFEYQALVDTLDAAGHWDEACRLALVTLDEPDKHAVETWRPTAATERRAFAIVKKGTSTFEAVVDVTARRLDSWRRVPGVQPGVLLTEEWEAAQSLVREFEPWREAVGRRGIEELDAVELVPLTAGYFGTPREASDRLLKAIAFDARGVENFWGRPIEGLVAVVSLSENRVLEVIDSGPLPIPGGKVDFGSGAPQSVAAAHPQDAITIDRHFVYWRDWSFHWRIDPRLGPVLSRIRYGRGDEARSVLYQASLSEMFVPYADPAPGWYFRAYMDAGEYGLGKLSSQLLPGLDCPEGAFFANPWFVDEWGNPYVHPRAACVFERSRDDLLWRHFESVGGATRGRPLTELVVRSIPSVGNYDYVLDWVFRPDGSIHVSVGATGVVQIKATARRGPAAGVSGAEEAGGDEAAYGRWVAEHSVGVNHDHFFSFRLDFDVDGRDNSLLIDRIESVAIDDDRSPRSSSWIVDSRSASTESEAQLRIDLARPALWRVANPRVRGPLGYPVSYQLVPGRNAVSLFAPGDFVQRRAGFIGRHLWATPYARDERYAAGVYPNQSRGGDGLPRWTSADRPIADTDLVVWYTLGMRHVVRAEDWPVVPTIRSGFELRPFDFFEGNPAVEADR